MRELGFTANHEHEADRVAFYKDYADEEGRRARAHVYFDKPILGQDSIRLANIVITVQVVIAPDQAAIVAEAPQPMRPDLNEVVTSFSHLIGFIPEQAVFLRTCVRCKTETSTFYVVNGDAICENCVEARRKANQTEPT